MRRKRPSSPWKRSTKAICCAIPLLAAGTLPGFYVEAVAVEPRGSWPLPLPDHYGIDAAHLAEYARLAATPEGFAQYLDRYVYEKVAA